MLSSIFKKKFMPETYAQEREARELQPVEYEVSDGEDSKQSKTIYYVPKTIPAEHKMFNPNLWNIDRFQIGRHVGRGKCFPSNSGTATFTSPASAPPSTSLLSRCCQRSSCRTREWCTSCVVRLRSTATCVTPTFCRCSVFSLTRPRCT